MNKFTKGFLAAISIIAIVGCSSLLKQNDGVFGKSQAAVQKVDAQVQVIDNKESQLKDDKLTHIGAFAKGGVQYSLDKITNNPPKEVTTAKQMNERVEALANQPDFNEVQSIEGIVDDLTSGNQSIIDEGKKNLAEKDKQIGDLQTQYAQLQAQHAKEISLAMTQANEIAKKADQYKSTLGQMDSWFGLGAVWYGAHRFLTITMWVLIIGFVLFIILRLLAGSNPIAAAIFGIFEQAVSCVVHAISFIFPKALSLAGHVSVELYDGAKSALKSIVDSVETVKLQGNASGTPPTVEDLLNTAELSMTPEDKALIEKIKLELGWVKPAVVPAVVIKTTTPITSSYTPPTGSVGTPPTAPKTHSFIPITSSYVPSTGSIGTPPTAPSSYTSSTS